MLWLVVLFHQCGSFKQGIEGKLIWVEGNQMPGPKRQPVEQKGVSREVYVYPVLTMADVKMEGVFVSEVNKPVYKKLQSDSSGKFIINLPPGVYSILIKEDAGLFVNSFDVKQQLNPITVNSGQVTRVEIIINYNAAY